MGRFVLLTPRFWELLIGVNNYKGHPLNNVPLSRAQKNETSCQFVCSVCRLLIRIISGPALREKRSGMQCYMQCYSYSLYPVAIIIQPIMQSILCMTA